MIDQDSKYCINWKVSPLPKVSPSSKVSPPYNVFLMGKSDIETPFSKVSPGLTIQIINIHILQSVSMT